MRKKSRIASLCMIWCVRLSDGERERRREKQRARERETAHPLSREFERGQSVGWMK